MLVNLADWCFRRRRLVVLAWLGALAASFLLAGAFGGDFRQDYLQPGSESRAARGHLGGQLPPALGRHRTDRAAQRRRRDVAQVRARADEVFADVAEDAHVVGIASPFAADGAAQVSEDGTTAYADVALDMTVDEYTPARAAALVDPILAAGDDSLQVEVGGPVAALSQTAPVGSEVIGLIAAAIILLVTFGSVVAMGLPPLTALFGLGIAMALGEVLRRVVDVPAWAPATAAMVGLGVGIDYALLIAIRPGGPSSSFSLVLLSIPRISL